MASKVDLETWVVEALNAHGGRATVLEVAKHVWANHEQDIRASGDLFYTWQYGVRWAAMSPRRQHKMTPDEQTPRGVWELA